MKKSVKIIIAILVVVAIGVGGFFGFRFYQSQKNDEVVEEKESKPEVEEIEFVAVSEKDALSEKEWMALVNDAFQYTEATEYSDEKITGSQAVFSGMKRLGGACLDYYLDGKEYTEENAASLAKDKKLIEDNYFDSYIGQEQAEALIENLKALQMAEDYHVEKNDVVLADQVVDGKEWKVEYYKHFEEEIEATDENDNVTRTLDLKDEVIASTGDYEPKVDDKIVYLDEYGIMHGGKIVQVEAREGDKYDILTVPVETQSELIDTYTVSGYVDWSLVTAMNSKDSAFKPTVSMCSTDQDSNKSTTTDLIVTGSGGNDGISVDSVTLGGVSIYEAEDEDEEEEEEEESDEQDKKGEESQELEKKSNEKDNNKQENNQKDEDDKGKDDKDDKKVSVEGSLSGNFQIALKNLEVYAYVKDDEEVAFEIYFEPSVTVDGIAAEAEIGLPNIPLGIGVLSCEIDPKIAISADLGLTLDLGAKEPVRISSHSDPTGTAKTCNENEVKCDLGNTASLEGNVDNTSISLGINLGFNIELCEFINVADPNVTSSFVAAGKQLNKKKGYDLPCYEMKLAGPIISLDLSSEDSLLGYFLTTANIQSSFELNGIDDDDKLLVAKYFHIEFDPLDVLDDPKGNASVCTHDSGEVDHSGDMKITFASEEGEDASYDENAEFLIEMNGQLFGFEFNSDEYKQQYLDYRGSLAKEDFVTKSVETKVLVDIKEPDIVDSLYGIDNANEYEEIKDGEFKILAGKDMSNLGFVSMHGWGPKYIHGHVVGHVTKADNKRYLNLLDTLHAGDRYTQRQPFLNLNNKDNQ